MIPKEFFYYNLMPNVNKSIYLFLISTNGLNIISLFVSFFLNNSHVLCVALGKQVGVEAGSPPSPLRSVE